MVCVCVCVCVCDETQCVMDRVPGQGLEVVELAEGVSLEDLRSSTGAPFEVRRNALCVLYSTECIIHFNTQNFITQTQVSADLRPMQQIEV